MPSALPDGDPAPPDGSLPAEATRQLGLGPFGLYVHVPFCRVRCGYCDFNTYTLAELGTPGADVSGYVESVLAELDLARRVLGDDAPAVDTIFFGGGTPTMLPAGDLVRVVDGIRERFAVAGEVVKHQQDFFRHGVSGLRPLTMARLAEVIAVHETTVSRAVTGKFLGSPLGTFELRYFFASGVQTDEGEAASATAVKAAIKALISAEKPNAPLSDDALVDLLKAQGFDLARRTVAKYREAIGLGSSHQRRRQAAISGKIG